MRLRLQMREVRVNVPVTTIHQPPAEDLRNAQQTAANWVSCVDVGAEVSVRDCANAFARIEVLIRAALDKLSEPNLAVLNVTQMWLDGAVTGTHYGSAKTVDRDVRDCAAAILRTALTGAQK
jgi:hypothetical protein